MKVDHCEGRLVRELSFSAILIILMKMLAGLSMTIRSSSYSLTFTSMIASSFAMR